MAPNHAGPPSSPHGAAARHQQFVDRSARINPTRQDLLTNPVPTEAEPTKGERNYVTGTSTIGRAPARSTEDYAPTS